MISVGMVTAQEYLRAKTSQSFCRWNTVLIFPVAPEHTSSSAEMYRQVLGFGNAG